MNTKQMITIAAIAVVVVLGGIYFIINNNESNSPVVTDNQNTEVVEEEEVFVEDISENEAEQSEPQIVGRWQSREDSNSVRVFSANGTMDEIYAGEVLENNVQWQIVGASEASTLGISGAAEPNVYLTIGSGAEQLQFELVTLNQANLTLIYLDGGVLEYTRVSN